MAIKILITGAGGYIGSIATYMFLKRGYEVVALDNFSTGYKKPLTLLQKKFGLRKLRFYETDLQDDISPILRKENDIQAVMHYAANCSVNESMKNPYQYFMNNTCSSSRLLGCMLKFNIHNIIFSSTCAVYGEARYMPIDEKHQARPLSPYGESKRMVEKMIEWYGKLSGMRYVILRYFNVCGASDDGQFGDSKHPSFHLVQNTIRAALGIEPLYLTCANVRTQDKTPIRDYVNVLDLNEAHIQAVEYLLEGGKSQILNLGTGTGTSVLEIVKKVEELAGVKITFKRLNQRQGEYVKMIASIDKAQKILGWKPTHTLEESVISLMDWYKRNPRGWES